MLYPLTSLPPSLSPSLSPESLSDAGEHDQLFLSDGLSLPSHQREPVSHMTSHMTPSSRLGLDKLC